MDFEVLSAKTLEENAYVLSFPLRQIYLGLGSIITSLRSTNFVILRKPRDWKPIEFDAEKYRESIKQSVPKGVR
jgi:hypothetical protein